MGAKDERNRRDRLEATTAARLGRDRRRRRAGGDPGDRRRRSARRAARSRRRAARPRRWPSSGSATLSAEVDALIAQANEIRHRSAGAAGLASRLRAELEPAQPAGPELRPTPEGWTGYGPKIAPRGSHLSAVEPAPEPDSAPEPEAPEPGPAARAGARLLATQMAVSGASREEIAARLRNGFEIDDTEAILDAILGPEG